MLATDNAIGQLPGLSSLSDEVDACYPTVYEDTKGLVDAFVVFTSSFSAHIIGQDGAIIWKDITTYGIDSSSNLRITVYTSETSLFTLSFTDAGVWSTCKEKLLFCQLSTSADGDGPGGFTLPHRSTSTLCRTELANQLDSHLDSPTILSTETSAAQSNDAGRAFSPEILCLYMHTSVFDESFSHVFRLFYDVVLLNNNVLTTLMMSPMKEDILDRTLTNLSAHALYPTHTRLHAHDLIGLLSVVNTFVLRNVTLSYELLSHDIRVTDSPGAHLRGQTPKDSFSIEETSYPYHSIRYLDILQQILSHRVISFSSAHQCVILSDERLAESIITALVLYFDSVCSFIGIFFGAPALAPLKRFFSTSSNVELSVVLSTSLYQQLQEILKLIFIVLSGCFPRGVSEHLLEFSPFHAAPTFDYQAVSKYFLTHVQNGDSLAKSYPSHKDTLEAIVYAHRKPMDRRDMVYNLLYLSFIIIDTFNQAATLDASISQLVIPNFSEKDSRLLFGGLLHELDAQITIFFLSLSLYESGNDSLVRDLLFGNVSWLISTESIGPGYNRNITEHDMELSVDAVVYNASRRFWLNAQPLIMLLRTLISIFQSSALFLFEFDPDLCVHFMNCILLVFMDEHLDLLHQAIAIEAERHLALNQRDSKANDASLRLHILLVMETLLRDFIQRISYVLTSILEAFTSISLLATSPPLSLIRQSCYRAALLGSVYLGRRVVRFYRSAQESPLTAPLTTYTSTCVNSIIHIFKQLTDASVQTYLDLSTYLMLTQYLAEFLNDTTESSTELTALKDVIASGLVSIVVRFIPQIPDGLTENKRDSIMSLSLGLEIITALDVTSLLTRSSRRKMEEQSILQVVTTCCTEQARLLSRFIALLPPILEAPKQSTFLPPLLPVNTEASMTINMLDLDCGETLNQHHFHEIMHLNLEALLINLVALYDHLHIQDFIDSFLDASKDSIVYSTEMMRKTKQVSILSNLDPELHNKIIDSVAHTALCLIADVFPFLTKEDRLFASAVETLSHTILGFLLLSLYRQLAVARTVADFYRPNDLFTLYFSLVKTDCLYTLFSPADLRILFVAIDMQSIIFRTLSRNVDVLRETTAAYNVLNLVITRLCRGTLLAGDAEVSASITSSCASQPYPLFRKEKRNSYPITARKVSQKSILAYLDNLSATLSYVAQREPSSVDAQLLILSAIASLFDCIAPTSVLQSEVTQIDELVDLRIYLESGHEAYSEVLLEEASNLVKNKIILLYIFKEPDGKRCNPLLLSALSTAIESADERLKRLGISLLYRCMFVIALKGISGEELFSFAFSPDVCAHLLSVFTIDTAKELLEPVLDVFDIGLQFLYEVEAMSTQKRRGLTSLVQYQTSYLKMITTLTALISRDHLSITESFYLRLSSFLTSLMILFNRLNLFKEFSAPFSALVNALIETAMPDYRQILGTSDPLPLLFSIANTLYTYLCMCMHEETFAKMPDNISKKKGSKRPSVTAHNITHLALSTPVDETSSERAGTVVITVCTILLNCFQSISETAPKSNDISFKKAISILYSLSQFGFAEADCVYILLYTYVGTLSHIGLLQTPDKDKEYDLQIKCVVRIFKAIINVIKNPCHSMFIEESLTNVLLVNGNDFLVFLCVCLAVAVRNPVLYKSLIQPYEDLARESEGNAAVSLWLSLFRLIKRARSLTDLVRSLADMSLEVLHCVFSHLVRKPAEQTSMFTTGPGRYLLSLLLHCFANNSEMSDNETPVSCTNPIQKPNGNHAQMAAEILALSMRAAPTQVSAILIKKSTMYILISSFEKLVAALLENELKNDRHDSFNQPDDNLDNRSMAAGTLGEILSIYADMALLRECSNIFRESNNHLLVLIAEFLQQLTQYYKRCLAGNQESSIHAPLQAKVEKCMTLAVLTLRNVVITAEDLSYITMNIKETKAYVLISGMYEYITLHTNPGADMAGLPAATEYLTIIIMHLITQAEDAGADHHAITLVKRYALQLEQKMQSTLQKDICVEECSALLGALNMLP
ncbi:hypothetical protein GL50803_0094646 [Giardia duodenalis]|uniref:Uncharacterized protein n=1 Tax=Giardia intestinalis (strain ATCC 50803 / WB clone C6) TaxID=184922 RepID=D3KH57_GIAIC|nr:hypothetical protein GL50803_0094646 [Giardia intestinalis]KAE8303427.1 hypothetical protein GL50803_0094646 [Giardia intestinalis]